MLSLVHNRLQLVLIAKSFFQIHIQFTSFFVLTALYQFVFCLSLNLWFTSVRRMVSIILPLVLSGLSHLSQAPQSPF